MGQIKTWFKELLKAAQKKMKMRIRVSATYSGGDIAAPRDGDEDLSRDIANASRDIAYVS